MLSYLLAYRGRESPSDLSDELKEQPSTLSTAHASCSAEELTCSPKITSSSSSEESESSCNHPLHLVQGDAAGRQQQCSPAPPLGKANTPSPEPFARRGLVGMQVADGGKDAEQRHLPDAENGTDVDKSKVDPNGTDDTKITSREPRTNTEKFVPGPLLVDEFVQENPDGGSNAAGNDQKDTLTMTSNDTCNNDDSEFYDAADVSFLGEDGVEDFQVNESNQQDAGDNTTILLNSRAYACIDVESLVSADFQSCTSRTADNDNDAAVSLHNNDAVTLESTFPSIVERLHSSNVSVLSSASAATFHTAICGNERVDVDDELDDDESDAGSFRTAASHLSRHTKATQATQASANTYATALSRVNNRIDRTYVLMPKRLIRAGHIAEGLSVLQDGRYISQRVRKLGAALSAELIVADCDLLMEAKVGGGVGQSSMQFGRLSTESAIAAKVIVIFERFRRYINDAGGASGVLVAPSERGTALFVLGAALDRRGMVSKSIAYFRSALSSFCAGVGALSSETTDMSYSSIVDAAGVSPPRLLDHVMIARALAYLGGLHEKKNETTEAVDALNTSSSYFERAISLYAIEAGASIGLGGARRAKILSERMGDAKLERLVALARLGGVYRRAGQLLEAMSCFDLIVAEAEREKDCCAGASKSSSYEVLAKLAAISSKQTNKLLKGMSS